MSDYATEIRGWGWAATKQEALDNVEEVDGRKEGLAFLGTVFALMPSGKYYTPWACSNVEQDEAETDEEFMEALELVADENGMFITSGEGDPCDLFAGLVIEEE